MSEFVRIAGVNVLANKRLVIGLTSIYGIGLTTAQKICEKLGIPLQTRTSELDADKLNDIRNIIREEFVVEGELRKRVSLSIKALQDMNCYRGSRHRRNLPVRGQRTRTNARTRKGRARSPVAAKKK